MTSLGEGQLALGRADALVGLPGRDALDQGLGIGEADVLDGEAHQAAGDVARVLAARQHARQPIERRVGVGAPERLVQGGNQVVVALLALVVERRAALDDPRQLGRVEHFGPLHRRPARRAPRPG